MNVHLNDEERVHYGRQMIVPEWGEDGQRRLKASRVLVVGAGGLGAPVLMYLAGAGVGHIGIADGDFVEKSNLHRQVIHATLDIDTPKVTSAAASMRMSNPHVEVTEHLLSITSANADEIVARYDLVADCTDNFTTRLVVASACAAAGIPLVSGAAQITDGTVTTHKPYLGAGHPCFRCLYPKQLGPELTPSCAQIGVAGPVLAVIGGIQAMEIVKEIAGFGSGLSGRMLIYDGLNGSVTEVELAKRSDCGCAAGTRRASPVRADQPPVTGG